MCGNNCDPPKQSVTDDRDEQNDAVYGQMRILKKQLLLLDDHSTTKNSTEDNTTSSRSILCENVLDELRQFTQNMTNYVRMLCAQLYSKP